MSMANSIVVVVGIVINSVDGGRGCGRTRRRGFGDYTNHLHQSTGCRRPTFFIVSIIVNHTTPSDTAIFYRVVTHTRNGRGCFRFKAQGSIIGTVIVGVVVVGGIVVAAATIITVHVGGSVVHNSKVFKHVDVVPTDTTPTPQPGRRVVS